jgi:hypothetical protein
MPVDKKGRSIWGSWLPFSRRRNIVEKGRKIIADGLVVNRVVKLLSIGPSPTA